MARVRATALLVMGGLVGHAAGADEPAWKPAGGTTPVAPVPDQPPPAPVAPPVVDAPVPPPTGVVDAPRATAPSPAAPVQELNQWLPARRYPADFPPKQPAPPTIVELAPAVAPARAEPAYHPVLAEPPPVVLPPLPARNEPPAAFPPLRLPTPTDATLPAGQVPEVPVPKLPDVKPKPAEPLPAPRQADPLKSSQAPAAPRASLAADCPPPAARPLDPPPGGAACPPSAVPVQGKVFGSPVINLSHDFSFRELFGRNQMAERSGPDVLPGSAQVAGPVGDPITDSFFVQTELLLWWAKRPNVPALATTSAGGNGNGFLGDPDTRTLLGPGPFGPGFQAGFRVRAGAWLDEGGQRGIDGSFFFLGRGRQSAAFDLPLITRPFFAPNFNSEFGEVVARPGLSTGRLEVVQDSFLWGADLNYKCAVCRTCDGSRGWLIGYRNLNLTERLGITEFITATGTQAPDPVGTQVVVGDRFETRNHFHGGQLGYWWTRAADRLELDLRGSVALGATNSTVDVSGFQQRTRPGEATQSFVGGLLAAGPNLGTFHQSAFSVVPEFTANLGYRLSPNLKVYAGYNFLYWSNVLRPGDQIDRVVDVTFVPNPPAGVAPSGQNRPTVPFTRSDFWAQGVQFGLEFRW